MKIYTKTGDEGETSLFAGGRVSKGHLRLHAYGTIDELNAIFGVVLAAGIEPSLAEAVQRIQSDLFVVGADLATPLDAEAKWIERAGSQMVTRLETEIDAWERELPDLRSFILPGGTMAAALLHQARTVCRRAERWAVMLRAEEQINPDVLRYINRLSDWLFVLSRVVNRRAGVDEAIWRSSQR